MKVITIKYWGHMGRQEETKFQCTDRKIDMMMRAAQRIDLSELSNCTEIDVLNLSTNIIEEVDLAPLSNCHTLTSIILENNRLKTLNLWPLSNCQSLGLLDIKNNQLPKIDLTPVFLYANIELDSSVVISADYILRFALTSEQLKSRFLLIRPDRAPWTATPVILWNSYETLSKSLQWSDISRRIHTILDQVQEQDWFGIQRGLMMGFSLDELSGYDGDPRDLLSTATPDLDYISARTAVFDRAVELLDHQVEEGGSTLFLDTESMKRTKASKLIPKIVEARSREMENAVVPTKGSVALMNSLWMTHYGFKILQALDVGTQHYGDGLNQMKESLDDLGFDLKTEEVASIGSTKISDPIIASASLKKYIMHIVEKSYTI
ncbi:MAG: hypothetical protein ACFFF9_11810 [Candidatus Thorarchaeota archaeon]